MQNNFLRADDKSKPRFSVWFLKLKIAAIGILFFGVAPAFAGNFRINQEGRILGNLPTVTNAILFDTSNADAVVSALQIFPVTNPWNEDISQRPLLANSAAMISQMTFDFTNGISSSGQTARKMLHINFEMNYVLVPANQARVPVNFFNYPDESDLDGGTNPFGLYPVPPNLPIEEWPLGLIENGDNETLQQWQTNDDGSDRHAIMVAPNSNSIWETWETLLAGTNWQASNGAKFDLSTNGLRPAGWTSGDAAGLPMFPALVRFDECERGMVEHACRITVKKSRAQYIYPATHFASSISAAQTNYPAMGQRLRLKANFTIPATWSKEEKAVALGLKKYGALVADNGSILGISVAPDDRWPKGVDCFDDLSSINVTNFEVIQTTGTNEGPRSASAPVAMAGTDQIISLAQTTQLNGFVVFSNVVPTILWENYSGPGTVTFANASLTNTSATFSAPGNYILELSAADGIHAVAYDAVNVIVTNAFALTISAAGANVNLSWNGGTPPFQIQTADALPANAWSTIATTNAQTISLPMTNAMKYFRIQSQ